MVVYIETDDPELHKKQVALQDGITALADELCQGPDGKVIATIAYNACVNTIVDIFTQAPPDVRQKIVLRFLSVLQANGAEILMGEAQGLEHMDAGEVKH